MKNMKFGLTLALLLLVIAILPANVATFSKYSYKISWQTDSVTVNGKGATSADAPTDEAPGLDEPGQDTPDEEAPGIEESAPTEVPTDSVSAEPTSAPTDQPTDSPTDTPDVPTDSPNGEPNHTLIAPVIDHMPHALP